MLTRFNILIIFSFLVIALFFARSVYPTTDTYWHLAVGKLTWENKEILSADPFVYASKDTSFVSTEWLAGLVYYFLVQNFGEGSLVYLRVLMGILTVYLVYVSLSFFIKSPLLKLNASLVIAYTLSYRLFDRPENFSFLFLSFVNCVYLHYFFTSKFSKLTFFLPIIFLAWPNIHGFAPLGVLLIGFYLFIFLVKEKFRVSRSLLIVLEISVSSILASILQPSRFFYFLDHLKEYPIAEYASLSEKIIPAHGPLLPNQISWSVYIYLLVFMATFLVLVALLKNARKNFVYLVLCIFILGLLSIAVKLSRMIPSVLLITLPLLLLVLANSFKPKSKQFIHFFNTVSFLALMLVLLYSIATKNIVGLRENFQIFTINNSEEIIHHFWYPQFPESAPGVINTYLDSKRVFTNMFWSNYILWYSPKVQVFSDALWHYRTEADIQDEVTLRSGLEGWEKLIEKYDIDTVINSHQFNFQPNHTPVYTLKNWRLVYIDGSSIIYAREDIIKSFPVELLAINPNSPRDLKIKPLYEEAGVKELTKLLEFDPKNSFAREQLIIYYTDRDPTKAKQIAQESDKLLPDNPNFSAHLAIIYAHLKNCDKSKFYANEAMKKSFNHPLIRNYVKSRVKNCAM